MTKSESLSIVPNEIILNKIFLFRDEKVMLDKDLAELYQIETRRLNEQVKRNIERFPEDFMFQLNAEEAKALISQNATSKRGGTRKLPYVFTEHGVLMLSSVLNTPKSIQVNIQIMRVFTKIRSQLLENTELRLLLEKLDKKTNNNTKNIEIVFQYIDELIDKKEKKQERNTIGYKIAKK